jgi:hypothetical protein
MYRCSRHAVPLVTLNAAVFLFVVLGRASAATEMTDLLPSTTTLAVGYRLAPPTGSLVLLTPSGDVLVNARPVAGRVTALTLERLGGNAAVLDEVRDVLLADPDVRFVYRALGHVPSGQLILPTDQIVMKVRLGVDALEVVRRLPPALAVVRRLGGADDEYVLRLVDARVGDPFITAAALAREPWVVWAEPDLVREYPR